MMSYALGFVLVTGTLAALSLKWELDKRIAIPWALAMGACACLAVALLRLGKFSLGAATQVLVAFVAIMIISMVAILILFFRDPERHPPSEANIIVSPADGLIKYVKEFHDGELPFALKNGQKIPLSVFAGDEAPHCGGFQIGISMSLLDVHVNRSPITGGLVYLKRIPGKFGSLKKISSLFENERVAAMIKGERASITIVLIASRLVRRIVLSVDEGQTVAIGQRIARIRFGSQVDVLIPPTAALKLVVKSGDRVKAGESVLARI